jgi:hypothetical protein
MCETMIYIPTTYNDDGSRRMELTCLGLLEEHGCDGCLWKCHEKEPAVTSTRMILSLFLWHHHHLLKSRVAMIHSSSCCGCGWMLESAPSGEGGSALVCVCGDFSQKSRMVDGMSDPLSS